MIPKIFDLDSTIANTSAINDYDLKTAPVIEENAKLLRHFYYAKHRIIIYTARDWWQYDTIEKWLKKHKIPYHSIVCGKPAGELWDDRARNINCKTCRKHI